MPVSRQIGFDDDNYPALLRAIQRRNPGQSGDPTEKDLSLLVNAILRRAFR